LSILLREHYGRNALTARQILRDPLLFLAFGFGSGLSRYMPGTLGSLAALPLFYLLHNQPSWLYGFDTLFCMIAGVWICARAAQKLGEHDYGGIVWDEVVGMLITLYGCDWAWPQVVLGFVWFRLFDILKPWPIRWLDRRVPGGLGIMLDDVLAGVLAALALRYSLTWF
jgi:phosphatidylglycerophosphatase A